MRRLSSHLLDIAAASKAQIQGFSVPQAVVTCAAQRPTCLVQLAQQHTRSSWFCTSQALSPRMSNLPHAFHRSSALPSPAAAAATPPHTNTAMTAMLGQHRNRLLSSTSMLSARSQPPSNQPPALHAPTPAAPVGQKQPRHDSISSTDLRLGNKSKQSAGAAGAARAQRHSSKDTNDAASSAATPSPPAPTTTASDVHKVAPSTRGQVKATVPAAAGGPAPTGGVAGDAATTPGTPVEGGASTRRRRAARSTPSISAPYSTSANNATVTTPVGGAHAASGGSAVSHTPTAPAAHAVPPAPPGSSEALNDALPLAGRARRRKSVTTPAAATTASSPPAPASPAATTAVDPTSPAPTTPTTTSPIGAAIAQPEVPAAPAADPAPETPHDTTRTPPTVGPIVRGRRRQARLPATAMANVSATASEASDGSSNSPKQATSGTVGEVQSRRPVLLVDGNGLAHRAFHALMNRPGGGFQTSQETPTSVCTGVLKSLQAVVRTVQPRALLFAFDHGSPFRTELAARLAQLEEQGGPEVTDDLMVSVCQELTQLTSSANAILDKPTLLATLKKALPASLHPVLDEPPAASPYKAGRQGSPPAFKQDMYNLQCLLAALRIPCLSVPHVEADDTLAALASTAADHKHPVSVLTADQDMLQLVDDARDIDVMLIQLAPGKTAGGPPYKVMKENDVVEKLGITPKQFADYRALTGDKSDAIPGVTGIGPKGAIKLLEEYNNVDGMYAALPTMTGPLAPKLAAGRKQAYVSRLLSQLGAVHVNLGDAADQLFQCKGFRQDEVAPLLQRLEMKEALRSLPILQAALGGEAASPLDAASLQTVSSLSEGPPGFSARNTDSAVVIEVDPDAGLTAAATLPTLGSLEAPAHQLAAGAEQDAAAATASPPPPLLRRRSRRSQGGSPGATDAQQGSSPSRQTSPTTYYVDTSNITDTPLVQSISATSVTDLSKVPDLVQRIREELDQVAKLGFAGPDPILAMELDLHAGMPPIENASKKSATKVKAAAGRVSKMKSGGVQPRDGSPGMNNPLTACVSSISMSWAVPAAGLSEGSSGQQQQQPLVALRSCVISFEDNASGQLQPEQLAALKAVWSLLSDPTICKATHDAKPWHRLGLELGLGPQSPASVPPVPKQQEPQGKLPNSPWVLGCMSGLAAPIVDTHLAAYLANPVHALRRDAVARRWGAQDMEELVPLVAPDTSSLPPTKRAGKRAAAALPELTADTCNSAAAAAQVWILAAHLNRQRMRQSHTPDVYDPRNRNAQIGLTTQGRQLLDQLEQPLQEVLADVEKTGVLLDIEVIKSLETRTKEKVKQVEQELLEVAGDDSLNMRSSTSVYELLYNKLKLHEKLGDKAKLPKSRQTGKLSTDAQALEMLWDTHPVVPKISEYRTLEKLITGYANPLLEALSQSHDGRVHTTYLQNGAVTGRFSCVDPNLQNIPNRSEFAREVRAAFIPRPGWRILSADYSQMELRIMAALSGEPDLCAAFKEGQDAHRTTAMKLFGLKGPHEVTSTQRQIGKQINFGVIYGMGANLLARKADLTINEAREFIKQFYLEFPLVTQLMTSNRILAATQGYVETAFGRRRYFDFQSPALLELRGRNPQEVTAVPKGLMIADEDNFRAAGNAAIQGTAADLMKLAMLAAAHELRVGGFVSKILLTIHDELVVEVEPSEEEAVTALLIKCMEGADGGLLSAVPLKVEVESSAHWA